MVTIDSLLNEREAVLVLSNGHIFRGTGFGATKRVYGELVFTTFTAAGYYEALTDPSNWYQLYVLTYPLIGNYGVPPWEKDEYGIYKWFESDKIHCLGFIVHEACKQPSHYESVKTLDQFLTEGGIPGIEGIDTRQLTKILRTEGLQVGMLEVYPPGVHAPEDHVLLEQVKLAEDPNLRHLVKEVSCKEPIIYSPKNPIGTVVLVDCGVKYNILRNLVRRGLKVIRVPYNYTYDQVMAYKPNGVVLSNGPGDPKVCVEAVELGRQLIEKSFPTFGICLGNQILGLSAVGDTYKQKFGHRGSNKPVRDLRTGRAYITSQNHSYAVNTETVKAAGFLPLFENIDDGSNEGIYHPTKPIFSSQFHPEAAPGPEDTMFLFDEFLQKMGLATVSPKGGVQ